MREYPFAQRTLPAVLADKARLHGDRLFLLGDRSLSYVDLYERIRRFAGGLGQLGVRAGDRVVLMLPNVPEMLIGSYGAIWAGALEVPVNTAYRGSILAYVLNDCRAEVIVIHAEYLDRLAEIADQLRHLRTVVVVGAVAPQTTMATVTWDEVAAGEQAPPPEVGPGDLMAIMYTSGTTGESKGVVTYHHQAYQYANPVGNHMLVDGEVVYVTVPLFHIGGQWAAVYGALLADGQVVLREKFSVRNFWPDVDAFGVTQTLLLGVMAEFLNKQPPSEADGRHTLRRAAMAPVVHDDQAFSQRFQLRINQGWGLTEAGCVTAPPAADEPAADRLSAGRLRTDLYEMRLVDADDQDVPEGEPGEAIVRELVPYVLMAGYWDKPEVTARTMRGGWLHTGDLLRRRPDGSYSFVDRVGHSIRRRGENISSLHIEQEVLAHPAVRECAAVAVPSEYSEDEVKVVIAAQPGSGLTEPELIAFLEPRLPAYMVPRYVELRDELPKTATGKIRKELLRPPHTTTYGWDREEKTT